MVVNDNACLLAKRGALKSIASKLAPTISLTEQHYGHLPGIYMDTKPTARLAVLVLCWMREAAQPKAVIPVNDEIKS
jgi:hypothetical protein